MVAVVRTLILEMETEETELTRLAKIVDEWLMFAREKEAFN